MNYTILKTSDGWIVWQHSAGTWAHGTCRVSKNMGCFETEEKAREAYPGAVVREEFS